MKNPCKRVGAVALALAMSVGLAACGGDAKQGGAGDQKAFTYWSMWQEKEPQAKILAQAIKDYEAKTGVTVNVEWQGREVLTKVTPLLASGTDLPDLVDQSFDQLAPVLGRADKAAELGDLLDEKVGDTDQTLKDAGAGNFSDVATLNDKQILLPYAANANVLWTDAAAHPELVEQAPETLDALQQYLVGQKAKGEVPVMIDGAYPYARLIWMMNVLRVHLGGADKLVELAGDKEGAGWDAPEVLAAAQYIEAMHAKGLFADDAFGTKWPYQQEKFAGGEGTVLAMGSWLPAEIAKSLKDGAKLQAVPFPGKTAGDAGDIETSVFGFAVPKDAENVDAAKAFAAFFLQPKYQEQLVKDAGTLPVLSEVAGPEGQDLLAKGLKDGNIAPVHGNIDALYPGWMEPMKEQTLELMTGKVDAKGFVANMKKAQVDYWKQNG
ncbi:ABC transporter substrate-binding protein [uncultured Tessaracoccus sp.]|uniref:ABC transporter substrate-binding protein n=1 Tax=uncultured Tessaracoccus sp. TaxID=905023 RepID=UPI0025FC6F44|nr:ABC transporter substrate-binding protein [uncultured Tessaracoccus sp.]